MSDEDDHPSDPDAIDPSDQALLDALARALDVHVSADEVIDRAEGLVAWLGVDAELAHLLDAAAAESAGIRGDVATGPDLEFAVADGTTVVELSVEPDGIRGWISGETPTALVLRRPDGRSTDVSVDEGGAFDLPGETAGTARLEFTLSGNRRIHTAWFVI